MLWQERARAPEEGERSEDGAGGKPPAGGYRRETMNTATFVEKRDIGRMSVRSNNPGGLTGERKISAGPGRIE